MKIHNWSSSELEKEWGGCRLFEFIQIQKFELADRGEHICRVWVNSGPISLSDAEDIMDLDLKEMQSIQIASSNRKDYLRQLLLEGRGRGTEILRHSEEVNTLFNQNESQEAWLKFDDLLEDMQKFCEQLQEIQLNLQHAGMTDGDAKWMHLSNELQTLVRGLFDSYYVRDESKAFQMMHTRLHFAIVRWDNHLQEIYDGLHLRM